MCWPLLKLPDTPHINSAAKLLGESVIQQLRYGALVSWPNMGRLCHLLNCQPGDILEYEDDSAESATDPE